MLRAEWEKDVTYSITTLPEDDGPEGYFESGDDEADAEEVAQIRKDYDSGNDWAWCIVKVTASIAGVEGVAYLGGCSYKSEKDFTENSEYYKQMCQEALDDLRTKVTRIVKSVTA